MSARIPPNTPWSTEEAPDGGGFFVREIKKNMEITLMDNGEFFGDLAIGEYYHAILLGDTHEELYEKAISRLGTVLQKMTLFIEEQK